MKLKNGKLILFFPSIVYEILQWVVFPLNYLIGIVCNIQPGRSVWNEKDFKSQKLEGSGRSLADIKNDIVSENDVAYKEADLVLLYDSLPEVSAYNDMIGNTWKGKILRTNASVLDVAEWLLVRPLGLLGLKWGKRFRQQDLGDPLIVRWFNRFYFPLPIWGNVCMIDVRWRDVPTATMIYDRQPWKDYFRLLHKENGKVVLLGVWTHKEIAGGWFTLTLDADAVTN
ncbi:MAG TPA: DUF4334 domain-containing protein [Leptospiraceae bacterium]|nr:DUF4334 domain-containing protein [Leptospiraceae bacterium]HMW06825.1 DUF4334 domain-containing protein [Leptospiraceae bacterium]HMX32158.1 DUF4334 domain-containing protein [Leptospiraceae bacterium]HMY32228.1 DUF4334 domain-containing protein [Leptospiraceae bacterium]HMZ67162.1 DUF4334 domain-containing protein [Leptospiraceae bacterium]